MKKQIEIYTSPDGNTQIDVSFEGETFWLNLNQISALFKKDKSVISRHLKNIFSSGELSRDAVVAKNATTATDGKSYIIEYFNLDVILSVGYRVNSKRGTQFRQWATQRLKNYLIVGYALNEKRLEQKNKEIQVLHDGIRILNRSIKEKINKKEELNWLKSFSEGLQLLDDYDHEALDRVGNSSRETSFPTYNEYKEIVNHLKIKTHSSLFGIKSNNGFDSAINQINRGFEEVDAYPSIEEKAAVLLYLIVKNHAFVDGNKRIAAACFLLFLNKNKLLFKNSRKPVIGNKEIVSLTLFVASSHPDEMMSVKNLIVSLLNRT
ncbi:RhuM family protein [Aquirufa sp. 5-AUSEE-100C1]